MNLDSFFAHFDLLTDAPNASAKLREIILQLAVRGKLVRQDPNDEPAQVLMENIKFKREKLENESNIKLFTLLKSTLKHNNYQLPQSWEWTQLGYVALIIMGQSPPSATYNEEGQGVPLINGPVEFSPEPFSETILGKFTTAPSKMCKKGDLLICVRGATTGRTNIAAFDACIGRGVAAIRGFTYQPYINYFVLASRQKFLDLGTGSTFPSISQDKIQNFPLPLPPLEEQKRIVEKCDRLLLVCDEIEKRQQQKHDNIVQMNDSAIAQLLSSQNPEDFRQHWQRIYNNFDLLYSIPETIPKLRQAILQLAVQGKLINQSSKEFKKVLNTHKVSDYVTVLNGYAFKSTWFINDGIRLLRNVNVGHGYLRWDDVARISEERVQEFQRFKLEVNDIVISLDRPIISTGLKVARITNNDLPCFLLQRVGKFEFKTDEVMPEFFFLWLQSPIFINAIDPGRSNGVPHISSKSIEAIPFNPPSKEEQKRIVEKCDALMSLCDKLESQLKQARENSENLMEIAARQILTT